MSTGHKAFDVANRFFRAAGAESVGVHTQMFASERGEELYQEVHFDCMTSKDAEGGRPSLRLAFLPVIRNGKPALSMRLFDAAKQELTSATIDWQLNEMSPEPDVDRN